MPRVPHPGLRRSHVHVAEPDRTAEARTVHTADAPDAIAAPEAPDAPGAPDTERTRDHSRAGEDRETHQGPETPRDEGAAPGHRGPDDARARGSPRGRADPGADRRRRRRRHRGAPGGGGRCRHRHARRGCDGPDHARRVLRGRGRPVAGPIRREQSHAVHVLAMQDLHTAFRSRRYSEEQTPSPIHMRCGAAP